MNDTTTTPRRRARDTYCRHRTAMDPRQGLNNQTCGAGIALTHFAKLPLNQLPCLGKTPEACARCPSYAPPTPEEIAAYERAVAKQIQDAMTARRAIQAEPGTAGEITCPVCHTGTRYWHRAHNGHIHTTCSTDTCVRWIE